MAWLAAIACVGCCALPLFVPLGLLTAAGVAAATTGLLIASGVLLALAGLLWFAHHRLRGGRTTAGSGCSGGDCSC
jgi:mercuric ion transport protein